MELILYYITENGMALIFCLVLMFVLEILIYIYILKFNPQSKMKVFVYGIFLGSNNMDIVKLSLLMIKSIVVMSAGIIMYSSGTYIAIWMFVLTSVIFLILIPRWIIYQIVYILIQVSLIYLIYTITRYTNEVDSSNLVIMLKIILILMLQFLASYESLRGINDIIEIKQQRIVKQNKRREVETCEK